MASAPKPLDYANYLKTPETMRRYDIVASLIRFMSPLTPGNTPKHVQQKLRDYAAAGVLEAWIAHPKQRRVSQVFPG